jgi:pimeloyl-ACP methyl ester carboxylesterase
MNVLLFGKPPESQPSAEEIERRQRNRANVARLDRGKPAWDQELYDQLPQVKAPTLILWGTNDGMIFPQQGKHFNERIPGSKLIYIEGGPHVLSAATPAEFLEHTLEFLGVAETAAR